MDVFGTAFLPNMVYFKRMLATSHPIIDLGEHFVKQTQRNRTFILSSGGTLPLIIPLRKSDSKVTKDILISYAEDWQVKALRAIRSSYKNAPYYEHYQAEFEALLMNKEELLTMYNRNLFEWLLKELGIDTWQLTYSPVYLEEGITNDYRNHDFYSIPSDPFIPYKQVFSHKIPFVPGLSVIDLLFNKGPESLPYLK
jgi:hypothetical protein